jgi:ABC-2 type transport system ATP-binding protein
MNTSAPLIVAEQLCYLRHGRTILKDLSFRLFKGQSLALLGVNGAGKSTLLKLLAGVAEPSSGRLDISGVDLRDNPQHARALIGYLPEQAPLYPDLHVTEYLEFAAQLRGLRGQHMRDSVARVLELCDLREVAFRLCGQLSKGYAQRVNLAQALVHNPTLLLLDEPTSGLDPLQARHFHELIQMLRPDHGIVFSTHHIEEAVRQSDHILMLHQGTVRWRSSGDHMNLTGEAIEQVFLKIALGASQGVAA